MKKFILFAWLILVSSFLISCESNNDDNSSSSSVSSLEKSIVVSGKSSDVIEGVAGDIYQFNGNGWRVIVTDKTKIYVQRESCSGLSVGGVNDVKIGYTIFFKYDPEAVDYIGTPNVIRTTLIEAYRPECISASNNIQYVVTVTTNTVTNTTTTTTTTTNVVRR